MLTQYLFDFSRLKMRIILYFSLFFAGLFVQSWSYSILVTVLGVSGSQNLVMYRLAEYLGQRGHDVVVLKAEVFPEAKSIPLKHAKELSYELLPSKEMDPLREMMWALPWEKKSEQNTLPLNLMNHLINKATDGCANLLINNTKIMHELRQRKFDVAVLHMIDFCGFGLMHDLQIRGYVWMSTAFMIDFMAYYSGVPYPSSYVPSAPLPVAPESMTFLDRGKSLVMSLGMQIVIDHFFLPKFDTVFEQVYGPSYPKLSEILSNTSLYFANSDPFFDYPRPTQHNIVYMGGFTSQKSEPLPDEFAKVLNESRKGVVVFSMGSVVNTVYMPNLLKSAFLNAFKQFPDYTFVCRMEGEIPGKHTLTNVLTTSWLPQKDLLAQPKVKALITHGGYNSLIEAIHWGVPLVLMPLFGDQPANAVRVSRLNVGVSIDKTELTEQKVYQALKTVLESKEIQENADRLGRMIQKKPVSSYDLAINWVEFLAEFKTLETLQPISRRLPFVKYYLVDLFALGFGAVFMFVFVFAKLITALWRKIMRLKRKKKYE